ncbi:hypothetical protein PENTCL1PPCAC_14305, partial [Pristionchus entomophagus]
MMVPPRMCCCSVTMASQIMAIVALIPVVSLAVMDWLVDPQLANHITLTVLAGLEVIACVLVVIANCTGKHLLLYPIIIIQ